MDKGLAKCCFMLHVGLVLYTQNCFGTANHIDRDMTSGTVHTRAPVQICLDEGVLLMNLLTCLPTNNYMHMQALGSLTRYSHHPTSMAIQCHQMVSGMLQLALKANHVRTLRSHPAREFPVSALSVGLASLDIQR